MYENLRNLRKQQGKTQSEFGSEFGLVKNTYQGYESGSREPNSDFWIAVAEKYHVSIDYLMGFCDDPQSTKYAVSFRTSPEEKNLVTSWRRADDRAKGDVAHALKNFGFDYVQPKKEQQEKEAM